MDFKKLFYLQLGIYALLLIGYSIFSYSLTAPNLILSSWPPYWRFQTWMWETFFNDRQLLSQTYLVIMALIFINYFLIINNLKKLEKIPKLFSRKNLLIMILLVAPLLVANNALSYDVFNYIFNAKMLVYYHVSPHLHTALEFARDDWTRFMHNTHTPAPYGYAWTLLSTIPYWLGRGGFFLTWLLFRGMSLLSLMGLGLVYYFYCIKQ